MNTIPKDLEHITCEWLYNNLQSYDSNWPKIKSIEPVVCGASAFSIGQITQLNITYENENNDYPTSLALKLHPAIEAIQQAVAAIQALKMENNFYKDKLSEVIKNNNCYIPTSYGGNVSDDCRTGFLLLEWLSDKQWEMKDITKGCDIDLSKRILKALAKTHTSFWNDNLSEKFTWLQPINDNPMKIHLSGSVTTVLPFALSNLKGVVSSEIYSLIENLKGEDIGIFLDECGKGNNVLLHNDVKLENMFIGKDSESICLIDWQTLRYGGELSLANEVIQFLSRNVYEDILKDISKIKELLDYYLQCISTNIDNPPSKDVFYKNIKHCSIMALVNVTLLGSRLKFPREISEETSEQAKTVQLKEARHYCVYNRSLALVESLQQL